MPEHKQHMTYIHFYELAHERIDIISGKKIKPMMEIVKFKTLTKGIWNLVPDIKLSRHIGLRYLLGTILGEVVKDLYVEMKVLK